MAQRRPSTMTRDDEPIRLVIVESRPVVGAGIRELLHHEPDIEIVAEFPSPDAALPEVERIDPAVVLVDVALRDGAPQDATRKLHDEVPEAQIVVLGRDEEAASLLGAMRVGAAGHVAEDDALADLASTIRRVADGEDALKSDLVARPELMEQVVDAVRDGFLEPEGQPTMSITPRELDVLRHVGLGLHNRQIAQRLELSEQTVKNHLSSILHKIGVSNRTQAVTYAVRQGWLLLDPVPAASGDAGEG